MDDPKRTENINKCSICLESIENDIEFLPCCHRFHTSCIQEWLKRKQICPLCKISIYANLDENGNLNNPESQESQNNRGFGENLIRNILGNIISGEGFRVIAAGNIGNNEQAQNVQLFSSSIMIDPFERDLNMINIARSMMDLRFSNDEDPPIEQPIQNEPSAEEPHEAAREEPSEEPLEDGGELLANILENALLGLHGNDATPDEQNQFNQANPGREYVVAEDIPAPFSENQRIPLVSLSYDFNPYSVLNINPNGNPESDNELDNESHDELSDIPESELEDEPDSSSWHNVD